MTEEQQAQREKVQGQINDLRALVASAGWKLYRTIAENQQTARTRQIVLTPLGEMDQVLAQEYMKGEIAGLLTALALPETMIEDFTAELDRQGDEE